jgi:HPt (histidine-containing phosphotransfer) domain-containing protein
MIIYDSKKQFVGIDEDNLKSLGYSNLASLLSEAADFADLFVKVPGHIHNFKHVHWIDFILCATDKNSSKAIIHANGKSFSCILDVKTIYLMSSPTKPSFGITLSNLRALDAEELQAISGDLQARPAPVAAASIPQEEEEDTEVETPTIAQETPAEEEALEISEDLTHDEFDIDVEEVEDKITPEPSKVEHDPYEVEDDYNLDVFEVDEEELEKIGDAEVSEKPMTRDDLHENLHEHVSMDEEEDTEVETPEVQVEESVYEQQVVEGEDESDEKEYTFDIQETADALEMDVATIQDFVNDFIMQAEDFKPKLYEAVENDDMIELKSLSHQLKGVAANLRIHDAQDILIQINKADDFTNSIKDLNKFYRIMAKLAGKEPEPEQKTISKPIEDPVIEDKPEDIAAEIEDTAIEMPEIAEDVELEDDALEMPEIAEDVETEDDALEMPEIAEDVETEDDVLEMPEIAENIETEDDSLEMPEIAEDVETEDDALEMPEIAEDVETEDDALEMPEIAEDVEHDDFDMLDKEQEELISSTEKNNILNEIDEINSSSSSYDKMSAANEIGLDEDSFNELFEDFSNESKILISEAEEAIDQGDSAKWQHAAVKLKGMSDNMRIKSFRSDLEALITVNDTEDAKILLDKINSALLNILEAKD